MSAAIAYWLVIGCYTNARAPTCLYQPVHVCGMAADVSSQQRAVSALSAPQKLQISPGLRRA